MHHHFSGPMERNLRKIKRHHGTCSIYEECLLRFESCQEYDLHTTFSLSGVDVMSECTTFCLILTVLSSLKTTVSNKVNISVPEIGHLWTTVTFNNPFLFKVSVTHEGNSSIQMYRQSVRLLPLTIPFYLKSQLLIWGTVGSRCIVRVCNCYRKQSLSILSLSY